MTNLPTERLKTDIPQKTADEVEEEFQAFIKLRRQRTLDNIGKEDAPSDQPLC